LLYCATIKDRDNSDYPFIETLIHFTRRAIEHGDNAAKDILLTEVFNRGKVIVWNYLKHFCYVNPTQLEDIGYDVLNDLVISVMDLTEKNIFWEVNCISCVQKLIRTRFGSSIKRWKNEIQPNQYGDDEGNGGMEDGSSDVRNPEDIAISKIQYNKLTYPDTLIVDLLKDGYTQEQIASMLGCSSRTIRNHIKSIRERMKS
jgi:hypothetical protein